MATIKGTLTLNEVEILEVSGDPSVSGGTPAPRGSIALDDTGKQWIKFGNLDTEWQESGTGSSGGTTSYQIDGGVAASVYGGTTGINGGGA